MMEKDAETEAEGFIQGETMSENAGDMETTTEHLTQAEGASENAEISETEMTETAEISESETPETEMQVVLDADGNIASGVIDEDYGHITWVIDADGKLTVTGTGDFAEYPGRTKAPWYGYHDRIASAKINIADMTSASCMFYECYNITAVDLSGFDTSSTLNTK